MRNANVEGLLTKLLGSEKIEFLFSTLNFPSVLLDWEAGTVTRAELAQAMNMALFEDLLERSPNGRTYTNDAIARGDSVHFDHGALRTVRWPDNGALPPGEGAFTRILRPLGFRLNGRYPLDKLGMTGRAYVHEDAPDEIAQFFLSELHPERFSNKFQAAVTNVVGSSRDPLTPLAISQLSELERDGSLPLETAQELLPVIVGAFARQHDIPSEADYEALLQESAEMAWIATEGNAFNHATDRVADVFALSDEEKAKGRPMKPEVERSRSGRVFQTAYRADTVNREFKSRDGKTVTRAVPGSFYEFITRKRAFDPLTRSWKMDLRFDAGNATGIFQMTANAAK
jgi:PAS domain-containing protein